MTASRAIATTVPARAGRYSDEDARTPAAVTSSTGFGRPLPPPDYLPAPVRNATRCPGRISLDRRLACLCWPFYSRASGEAVAARAGLAPPPAGGQAVVGGRRRESPPIPRQDPAEGGLRTARAAVDPLPPGPAARAPPSCGIWSRPGAPVRPIVRCPPHAGAPRIAVRSSGPGRRTWGGRSARCAPSRHPREELE